MQPSNYGKCLGLWRELLGSSGRLFAVLAVAFLWIAQVHTATHYVQDIYHSPEYSYGAYTDVHHNHGAGHHPGLGHHDHDHDQHAHWDISLHADEHVNEHAGEHDDHPGDHPECFAFHLVAEASALSPALIPHNVVAEAVQFERILVPVEALGRHKTPKPVLPRGPPLHSFSA